MCDAFYAHSVVQMTYWVRKTPFERGIQTGINGFALLYYGFSKQGLPSFLVQMRCGVTQANYERPPHVLFASRESQDFYQLVSGTREYWLFVEQMLELVIIGYNWCWSCQNSVLAFLIVEEVAKYRGLQSRFTALSGAAATINDGTTIHYVAKLKRFCSWGRAPQPNDVKDMLQRSRGT